MKNLLCILAVSVLLGGCFKKVSYDTNYVLKPMRQGASGEVFLPVEGAVAYAFAADTAQWTVASYDDALAGILTSRSDPALKNATPIATAEPFEMEGAEGWIHMQLSSESQFVLAVDPVDRLYAYTQQTLGENLPDLYVSLPFKPWKEGNFYKEGNWLYFNEFYVPPTFLECYLAPSAQTAEDGPAEAIPNLKAYAYAVDTTAWYIASYEDAVAGKIISKTDSELTRTSPDFTAYPQTGSDLYTLNVSSPTLMVVVVDRTHGMYAYSKQEVDLEAATGPTFSVVFRPWTEAWITVEEGWRIVDPAHKPAALENPENPENPENSDTPNTVETPVEPANRSAR